MRIGIGNDHAATDLKFAIVEYLESKGYEVVNYGTDGHDSCPRRRRKRYHQLSPTADGRHRKQREDQGLYPCEHHISRFTPAAAAREGARHPIR